MTLSDRLKKLIEEKGVTPYEISQKTGISQSTLSRIINNATSKPNIKNIEMLSEYFHISKHYLLTGKGEMLKSEQPKEEVVAKPNENEFIAYLKEEIEELRIENKRLMKQNTYYELLLNNNGINYKQTAS